MKNLQLRNTYTLFGLVIFYFVFLGIFSRNATHMPYGDGFEYVMMTESFVNHGSPDLREADAVNYETYLKKRGLFVHKQDYVDNAKKIESGPSGFIGYFKSKKNNQWYSYHFWTYSFFAVPFRMLIEHLNGDIRVTALMTNLFFIFLGVWLLLGLKKLDNYQKILLSLLFLFSPFLWYIDWAHSEVLTGVFVFLAILYYHEEKKYTSLLLFSIACTQAQPLVIPTFLIFLEVLWKNRFNWKAYIKLFFCCVWVIVPLVYYFIYFSKPSINSGGAYTDLSNASLTRLWSFFFDLNQGVLLGIPLILLLLFGFLLYDLFKKNRFRLYYFLLSALLMSPLFMMTTNWNHGSSVINRYAIWFISMITPVLFLRMLKLKKAPFIGLLSTIVISQAFVIFTQIDYNKVYWHANNFNALSKYVMNVYPNLYNPEPQIFINRNSLYEFSSTDSVHVYTDARKIIQKMLIKKGSIGQLEKRGISKQAVDSLDKELNYYQGYAYVNKPQLEELSYRQDRDTFIHYIEKTKKINRLTDIRNSFQYNDYKLNPLKVKAAKRSISVDSILTEVSYYVYNKTREKFLKKKEYEEDID